tara:strand:- start:9218 stop:9595 length:378 start_codon:yes stop_codon:yes gene_type:complete
MMTEFTSRCKVVGNNTTDLEYAINASLNAAKIKRIYLIPNVSVSASDTDYITLTVKKGSTTLLSRATTVAGGALTAGTVVAATITGTGGDLERAAAGVFEVAVAKAGTGPAYDIDVVLVMEGVRS